MSKNIKVIQDGVEKKLSKVEKIQTYLANGNICNWVPEDEYPLGILTVNKDGVYNPAEDANGPYYGYSRVNVTGVGTTEFGSLAEITITKNGEYIASGDSAGPFYGYSKVIVNVDSSGGDGGGGSHSVPGKDDDGDDAVGGVDDDGNIVIEKLPTRISISVYPNNLVYEDGQLIDFTGLKVKAYLPNDTEWGIVDDNELIKSVTVAEGEAGEGHGQSGSMNWIYSAGHSLGRSQDRLYYKTNDGKAIGLFLVSSTWRGPILISDKYESAIYSYTSTNGPGTTTINPTSFQYNDTTIYINYYHHYNTEDYDTGGLPIVNWEAGTWEQRAAEYLDEHNYDPSSDGSSTQQVIPIQWKRTGDRKVLETSFSIAVYGSNASDDSGDSGGGN